MAVTGVVVCEIVPVAANSAGEVNWRITCRHHYRGSTAAASSSSENTLSPLCQRKLPHFFRVHRPHNPEVGVGTTDAFVVQKLEQVVGIREVVSLQQHAQRRGRDSGVDIEAEKTRRRVNTGVQQ